MPKQNSTYLGDELFEREKRNNFNFETFGFDENIYIKNIETQNEKQSFIRVLI